MRLLKLRDQIDRIDRELVGLLGKRFEITREIAHLKKKQGVPILDAKRESAIMERIKCLAQEHRLSSSIAQEIFQILLDYTRREMEEFL